MMLPLRAALLGGFAGGLGGAAALLLAFVIHRSIVVEMDRNLPVTMSGFHPVERAGPETFAWTGATAVLRLPGLDRRGSWRCGVRVRGGRADGLPQPLVELSADGITLARQRATNDYQDIEVIVPPRRSRTGLTLTIASTPTFIPGPGDRRELGVQVDRVRCGPGDGGIPMPPRRAFLAAGVSGAAFGVAFGVTAPGMLSAAVASLLVAAAQAIPLSAGTAPFHAYQGDAATLGMSIAALLVLVVVVIRRIRRAPLSPPAWFVAVLSAAVLFLQLLALLHPLKDPVDVVFHAHRFQGVLAGNYFFTQPMPGGVQFPYAIALYMFAAPWSAITADHATLLRIVVCGSHVAAGALLYVLVVRLRQDEVAAAAAVFLFHLVPLPYIVIGNANLTYAFGQSVATMAIVAAAALRLQGRDVLQAGILFTLASVAFLSHVGVFPLLFATLLAMAVLYWWRGGPALRPAARWLTVVAVTAAVLSFAVYYGRFAEAYKTLDRVRGRTPATEQSAMTDEHRQPAPASTTVPRQDRLVRAGALLQSDVGWPILLFALAGAWRLHGSSRSDRLKLTLAGVGATYAAFIVFSVGAPVEARMQRYADEFISRVDYATAPGIVVLAAIGAVWSWRAGGVIRAASVVMLAAAIAIAAQRWLGWLT